MLSNTPSLRNALSLTCIGVTLLGRAAILSAQPAPIIQPGAPGQPVRELSADEAVDIADTSYTEADRRFMQDMIPHHHQALEMAELAADRTNNRDILDAAGRINASQQDEIEFMQRWLRERGEEVPDPTEHSAMHTDHMMAGMATPEQMAELAGSEGIDFDRLFLGLMITHHEGAVSMVEDLQEQPGAAYDPVLFEFTNDVNNGQTTEIERMSALLAGLSADRVWDLPRDSTMRARRFPACGSFGRCPSRPGSSTPGIRPSCLRNGQRTRTTQAPKMPQPPMVTTTRTKSLSLTSAIRC